MNIYFSGIGGVGIGPLAEIAYDAGYSVSGSDMEKSLVTHELEQRGIVVSTNQDGSFLESQNHKQSIDWFLHTAALPNNHPELLKAKNLGIKTAKRDELIARIIKDKNLKLIAIAGTHGKTTTTGIMLWVLQQLGESVSYSIGTTINFGPSGKFDSASKYFIYECDEFDKNFLHFSPFLSIITSIDYDHRDTYPTTSEYLTAFKQFGIQSQSLISWSDQHQELFDGHPDATIVNPSEARKLSIAGEHNRKNATLVQIAAKKLGFSQNTDDIIARFPGTNRRFENLLIIFTVITATTRSRLLQLYKWLASFQTKSSWFINRTKTSDNMKFAVNILISLN
jgi:UDP-N-acetylmuramate--alanine ligase